MSSYRNMHIELPLTIMKLLYTDDIIFTYTVCQLANHETIKNQDVVYDY